MLSTDSGPQYADLRMPRPPRTDERKTLIAFLQWHRLTLAHKCQGLNADQLALRSVGRSELSLLGLLRHCADGERFWFRQVMAGLDSAPLFASAFDVADATVDTVSEAWQAWRAEIAFAEALVDDAPDLDTVGHEPGEGPVSLRWVLMHMIEEYARHNGHADLLREQIDGSVGL